MSNTPLTLPPGASKPGLENIDIAQLDGNTKKSPAIQGEEKSSSELKVPGNKLAQRETDQKTDSESWEEVADD